VSGHHGTFILSDDGIAIRDDGSTRGTMLDGAPLTPQVATALPDRFELGIAGGTVVLRGTSIRDLAGNLAALRLERTGEVEHQSYVLVVTHASIGSGPDDAVPVRGQGVESHHIHVAADGGRFFLRARGVASVGGRPLPVGNRAPLASGDEIALGEQWLRFRLATDDDMKPR
jgi:pSer/pThr/pTyr-binding forkhead associated (FHA) protein